MIGKTDLMNRPTLDLQRLHAIGDHDAGIELCSSCADRGKSAMNESGQLSELRRDLNEELGLQLRQMRQRPRHPAGSVMLSESVSCEHVGITRVADLRIGIVRPLFFLRRRI